MASIQKNQGQRIQTLSLPVQGMSCGSCVGRVEKALTKVDGIVSAQVNLGTERAQIEYTSDTRVQSMISAVLEAGYEVPTEEVDFRVSGMTCSSCINHVELYLAKIPGLLSSSVNLATERARVTFVQGAVTQAQLSQAVADAGYEAQFDEGISIAKGNTDKQHELKRDLNLLLLSALLTAPLVIPMIIEPFGIHWMLPAWLQLALATPVQFWLGSRFYRAGYRALKAKTGNMDLLVALGTTAAFGLSLLQMWQSSQHTAHEGPHLYFESSAVIITLILLGKYLESRAKQQTSLAIKALQSLRPELAHTLREGKWTEVPVESLKVGDLVLAKAGERIAVDGEIVEGLTQVDESMLTGESLPVEKSPGQKVTGGSLNGEGAIAIRTTALGAETTLARIIRLVETAQAAKAPIQRLVDRVSSIFVPIVILLAVITILGWGFYSGDWQQALINGIAVLVIACPCALGLATPTSIMVGTGLGAKIGILIKDAEALEITHSVTTVAFDKTGTLTVGKPSVTDLESIGLNHSELLSLAAAIQQGSEHPLAKAVMARASENKIELMTATSMKTRPGYGVEAQIQSRRYLLGNKRMMAENGFSMDPLQSKALKLEAEGKSVSYLASVEPHSLLGLIGFSDTIKEEAKGAVARLHALGIKTVMVTGDNRGSADAVARQLGIDEVRAEVLPGDKAKVIEELKSQGQIVAMVGDGINDAPALSTAHVGFAMSTGTEVAMHSAGVTLMRGNPLLIADAIELSRKTYRKIQQNLFWAFIYNLIGIPLAAFGMLNPMIAGAAMAFSSVSVVTNALLLKRWKPMSQQSFVRSFELESVGQKTESQLAEATIRKS